jgi:hypothetical protein
MWAENPRLPANVEFKELFIRIWRRRRKLPPSTAAFGFVISILAALKVQSY